MKEIESKKENKENESNISDYLNGDIKDKGKNEESLNKHCTGKLIEANSLILGTTSNLENDKEEINGKSLSEDCNEQLIEANSLTFGAVLNLEKDKEQLNGDVSPLRYKTRKQLAILTSETSKLEEGKEIINEDVLSSKDRTRKAPPALKGKTEKSSTQSTSRSKNSSAKIDGKKLKDSKSSIVGKTGKVGDSGKVMKSQSNRKTRKVKDNEIIANSKQTTLTQHFQVRRSERKITTLMKEDLNLSIKKKILSGDESGLEIRVLEDKGRGIFSTKSFVKGEFICEYAGELIDYKEAKDRELTYGKDATIGSYMYFFQYKNKKYCVDATKETDRLGRLLNHSKVVSNVTTELFPIEDVPHLILVAKKDIGWNEELVYDYGDRSKSSIESHPWLKL